MTLLVILLILVLLLAVAGLFFANQVVLPKKFTVEDTYRIEVEKGYLLEDEFNAMPQQEVRITSPYGYPLFGLYFPQPKAQKTVVIAHGITYTLYGMVKYMGMFYRRGYNVLLYDHRNHGRSGGKNSTFGYYEKNDLKAMFDWALAQLELGGRVGVMGESFGAATVLQFAAMDARPAFVVSDCAFSDLQDLLAYRLQQDFHLPSFPLLPLASFFAWLRTGMRFSQVSPQAGMAHILAPVLIVHGAADTYIPPRMAQDLLDAKSQGLRRLYLCPGAEHALSYGTDPAKYDQQIGLFLEEIGG